MWAGLFSAHFLFHSRWLVDYSFSSLNTLVRLIVLAGLPYFKFVMGMCLGICCFI